MEDGGSSSIRRTVFPYTTAEGWVWRVWGGVNPVRSPFRLRRTPSSPCPSLHKQTTDTQHKGTGHKLRKVQAL